jgi:hypothetical protein
MGRAFILWLLGGSGKRARHSVAHRGPALGRELRRVASASVELAQPSARLIHNSREVYWRSSEESLCLWSAGPPELAGSTLPAWMLRADGS